MFEIEPHAALARVAVGKIAAAIDSGDTLLERRGRAQRIHARCGFDLDYVGPEVGQQLGRVGSGADPGEVGDANAGERQLAHQIAPAFRRTWSRSGLTPSPTNTSRLCSPSVGAGRPTQLGVADI